MFYGKNDNKKNLKINKRYGKNWLVIIVSNELKSNGFELWGIPKNMSFGRRLRDL